MPAEKIIPRDKKHEGFSLLIRGQIAKCQCKCQSKFSYNMSFHVTSSDVRKAVKRRKDVWYGGNLNLHFPLSLEYQYIEIHAQKIPFCANCCSLQKSKSEWPKLNLKLLWVHWLSTFL